MFLTTRLASGPRVPYRDRMFSMAPTTLAMNHGATFGALVAVCGRRPKFSPRSTDASSGV
jgi:hypothetical protein